MKKKTIPTSFKFWKNNMISQEYELSLPEIIKKFKDWMKTRKIDWLGYYSTYDIVCTFVGDKEENKGLSSVMEMKRGGKNDYEKLSDALKKTKTEFLFSTKEPK